MMGSRIVRCRLRQHLCRKWQLSCDICNPIAGELIMWTKPAYEDLRIGFEVTMYFANR